MSKITDSMFLVNNFLCCLDTHTGTKFLLYLMFIVNFVLLIFFSCLFRVLKENVLYLFLAALSIPGIILSIGGLLYFPELNKKYHADSRTSKFLKYFSFYNGLTTSIPLFLFLWAATSIDVRRDVLTAVLFLGAYLIFHFGVFMHFMTVAYSFYRSIVLSLNETQEQVERTLDNEYCDLVYLRSENVAKNNENAV